MSFYSNSTLPEQLREIQKFSKESYDTFKKKHKPLSCGGSTKYKTKEHERKMKVKKQEQKPAKKSKKIHL